MPEIWLRPNGRAIRLAMIGPLLLAVVGLLLAWSQSGFARAIGYGLLAVVGLLVGLLVQQLRQPRLAYRDECLLVYLCAGPPIRVPIEIVEGFFLGSGPLKLSDAHEGKRRTVNLVVRLAEKATDWATVPVKAALGDWAESYITIRGAWCERLTLEVVQRLNVRLHEIQHASAVHSPDNPG